MYHPSVKLVLDNHEPRQHKIKAPHPFFSRVRRRCRLALYYIRFYCGCQSRYAVNSACLCINNNASTPDRVCFYSKVRQYRELTAFAGDDKIYNSASCTKKIVCVPYSNIGQTMVYCHQTADIPRRRGLTKRRGGVIRHRKEKILWNTRSWIMYIMPVCRALTGLK